MEDLSYVPTGKPEDWTYKGMKVYNYMEYFPDKNTYVETFIAEDGMSYEATVPRHQWNEEIKKLAKEQGIL